MIVLSHVPKSRSGWTSHPAIWFGFTDDYRLIVSEKIERSHRYFQDGDTLSLPHDAALAPATEALRWHRKNRVERV